MFAEWLTAGELVALTGAGVSTDSGIPDYRDEQGNWKQSPPMQLREFIGSELSRRRYWARSMLGFQRMATAQPNRAHRALAEMERRGLLRLLVTQNVDGLHSAAGSQSVVDLHGRLDRVICLDCRQISPRSELQARLTADNPDFVQQLAGQSLMQRPDGDMELAVDCRSFRVSACTACGGVLKPDVVFFGENVPAERVQASMAALERARALLIVGSSLMVFSGYRFARAACRLGIPIVVVNRGKTRADELSVLRLTGNAGELLEQGLQAAS